MTAVPSPWKTATAIFVLNAFACLYTWAWLGAPEAMPASPITPDTKLDCVSYTPFQAANSPFDGPAPIAADLIAADVARLAPITKCLRTYSAAGHGIEQVAAEAGRLGLSVLQGAWIARDPIANSKELAAAATIAKAHPGTVTAIVAGNEVLLRQEQTPQALVQIIEQAKALSGLPVTYADVWEFWLKNPQVADAVDFITIHILPFWEDEPVAASNAAQHVAGIYARVTAAFPSKRIIIGEVGWPSAGRMRAAALPSPINQARVLHEVAAMTREQGITTNFIEAFDQPWKRRLEGTVGGHWGLFDANARAPKFAWGQPVSNHPLWRIQAAVTIALAGLVLMLSARVARMRPAGRPAMSVKEWAGVALIISATTVLTVLSVETLSHGAIGASGIIRALALGFVALTAPFVAVGVAGGACLASFAQLIGPPQLRTRCPLSRLMGLLFAVTFVAAIQVALSLTFDPRYWEFPFAPLSAAALVFAILAWTGPSNLEFQDLAAEKLGAIVLAGCAAFIAIHEGWANWQALWLSAALGLLALTMWWKAGWGAVSSSRKPAAPRPK